MIKRPLLSFSPASHLHPDGSFPSFVEFSPNQTGVFDADTNDLCYVLELAAFLSQANYLIAKFLLYFLAKLTCVCFFHAIILTQKSPIVYVFNCRGNNKSGTIVIQPIYEKAGDFLNGYAPVCIDKRWGYINTKGDFLVKPKFVYAFPFSCGLAKVCAILEE
jgi:hypothetical protein